MSCNCSTADEIEFDLDPRDVQGPERFHTLVEFMRGLASSLGKPVLLTAESAHDAVILRARLSGEIEFVPAKPCCRR